MKIALVMAHGKVHNHVGGAPKVFFDMANYFNSVGHEVLAIYSDDRDGSPYYKVNGSVNLSNVFLPKKKSASKIYREIIRGISKISGVKIKYNPVTSQKQKRVGIAIESLLNEQRPDVVIAYHVSDLVSLQYVTYKPKKVITMFHTHPSNVYFNFANYERRALNQTDLIQVLLPSQKEWLEKQVSKPIEVIGNAVEQHLTASDLDSKKIIYLARIEKNKQQHLIIEAMRRIPRGISKGWEVNLFGSCNDEGYKKYLQDLIVNYNMEDLIFVRGGTEDPKGHLYQSAICLFPSKFEGFGLGLAEAMSIGLPCVGFTSCSGVNEIITDKENGYLANDIDEFSLILEKLMNSHEQRYKIGLAAKKMIGTFSPEIIWSKWNSVISDL